MRAKPHRCDCYFAEVGVVACWCGGPHTEPRVDRKGRTVQMRVPRRPCGAKTRKGAPCQAAALTNGRCGFHGGLSTGPRTSEGKARLALAQRERWRRYREARAALHAVA